VFEQKEFRLAHFLMVTVRFSRAVALRAIHALGVFAVLVLAGCMSGGQVQVHQPSTARPHIAIPPAKPIDGAIFAGAQSYRPLFEDRRARAVGDTVVINITERLQASLQSRSSADRQSGTTMSIPIIKGLPGKSFQGAQVGASSDTNFEGRGETSNLNVFTGTIAVTVVEVLGNGNLVVSGEKQIGLNHNSEIVRFSGVVNPVTVVRGNQVTSTDVADVRLEYFGRGYIDQAQAMPWLQKFFMSVLPF
jgi:flagellar L-ring protein FlgH